MSDFISKSNCGQILLSLVARGSAIIAEILRLSQYIPAPFRSNEQAGKYAELISDLSYFKTAEYFESRIESRSELQDLDAEFRETHLEILRRFYLAFESVHKYVIDLNRYLEDLDDGVFVQQSLESVMLNDDGRQLLIEALYLYGVMLLIIDARIEGVVREKLLVSYHRYAAQDASKGASNIDEVCKLMRSTGYIAGVKRPAGYPETFLTRIPISSTFVRMAIGRLRSDDVYHQIAAYPLPEHRSVALAQQAAMLYVVLYFASDLLERDAAKMREIVDKHFPDNFVISVYMGIPVNLVEAWAPYRAAATALNNTLDAPNIKGLAQRNGTKVRKLRAEIDQFLKEGFLTEEFVSDNIGKLMNVLREANATLRWLILHTSSTVPFGDEKTNKRSKQLRDQLIAETGFEIHAVLALLVNTSQLELKLRELLRSMLTQKRNIWERYRKEGEERLVELSEVYSGAKPLTRVERNEHLQAWFAEMGRQIANLSLDEATTTGRKIVQLMQALEEVQEFHQLESNLQVKQFLADTRTCLHNMLRTINIKEDMLVTLQIVGDLSYAWELVDQFTATMQESIKAEPALVTRLRATFLKLASTLDMPLLRINQAQSDDLLSVSQYYSNELVAYVRRVLQVIPETMFQLLARIIELETKHIRELPTRLDKDKMKDFAQLDERYQVAQLTHAVSTLTEGILTMKTTLVGIIKVDPRQLLEDGIRKELVKQITRSLHGVLLFNPKARVSELVPRLDTLFELINGLSRSFEYIQDYINVHGLKIWNEELTRILNFYVEQECNTFLRTKVLEWQSIYQSSNIPIPVFANVPDKNDSSVNYIGRLARELMRVTDPRTTMFLEQRAAWYDVRTKVEVLNPKVFQKVERALSNAGLNGLIRVYSFMVSKELQDALRFSKRQLLQVAAAPSGSSGQKQASNANSNTAAAGNTWLDEFFASQIGDSANVIQQPQRAYATLQQKFAKQLPALADSLCRIGQLQLLRRALFAQLAVTAQFDSKYIYCALETFNRALLIDIEEHYRAPASTPYPDDDNPLLFELATYLEAVGIGQDEDAVRKVFITAESVPPRLDLVLAALLFSQLGRFQIARNQDAMLVRRTGETIDVLPFVYGLATLLKQLHADIGVRFVALSAQFVRSHIEALMSSNAKSLEVQPDVLVCVSLLDLVANRARIERSTIDAYVTPTVRDSVARLALSMSSAS